MVVPAEPDRPDPLPMIATPKFELDLPEPPSTELALPDEPDRSSYRPTAPAEACIARFARLEADVSHDGLVGVGRHSAARFPRLGGVLHDRIAPGSEEAALLLTGTTQTALAGYQVVVATGEVANEAIAHHDTEALWAAFVPVSYRVPQPIAQSIWDVCRFEDYWVALLVELGLDGDASRFGNGQTSSLSRSIRGLSTVGTALALAERGARRERLRPQRRPGRERRIERWDLPPVPRRLG